MRGQLALATLPIGQYVLRAVYHFVVAECSQDTDARIERKNLLQAAEWILVLNKETAGIELHQEHGAASVNQAREPLECDRLMAFYVHFNEIEARQISQQIVQCDRLDKSSPVSEGSRVDEVRFDVPPVSEKIFRALDAA